MSKRQPPTENLWMFNYKHGPAPLTGMVRARDEGTALRVATAWCATQEGVRILGSRPRPMVLADESILPDEVPGEVPEMADAVAATTR